MQKLPQIIFALTLSLLVGPAPAKAQLTRERHALLVAECTSRRSTCNTQHLVKYTFRDDGQVSREVILTEPVERVSYYFGGNHIYRGRYVITRSADVVDIKKKRLLHSGIGEYLGVEGNRVIQKVERTDVHGYFYFDLKSGKYSRLRSPGKWALPGLLAPNQTKSISAEDRGSGNVWLHHLNGKKRLLASGLRATATGCSFPKPPLFWISSQRLLTQRADGEPIIIDMRGRVTPLPMISLKTIPHSSPEFHRNEAGHIIYTVAGESYLIDVNELQHTQLDSRWTELGSGFEWEANNGTSGRMIRFNGKEIGRWWVSSMRTTAGRIAAEYGEVGYLFGIPKGLKVWSESNNKWVTIDPVWLDEIIGWVDEDLD